FQAEDGIRDFHVTGVQTCALPIFDWSVIIDALPSLMEGTEMTVKITFLGLLGGTILGFLTGVTTTYVRVPVTWRSAALAVLVLMALYFLSVLASWLGSTLLAGVPDTVWTVLKWAIALGVLVVLRRYIPLALSFLCQVYILVIRGTPIVVQVMFIYFALPLIFGWRVEAVPAAIFTLVINSGAYIAEIVRGALQSVPKGLKEAGQAMGLPFYKILLYIIGPV